LERLNRISISIAAAAAAVAICASCAQAATITLGSPLTGTFDPGNIGCDARFPDCTTVQSALPGAATVSPVDGLIVRWRLLGAAPGASYRLQVLSQVHGLEFLSVKSSDPGVPNGGGLETFETALPIKAGQLIGLDQSSGIAFRRVSGARALGFVPGLIDGAPQLGVEGSGTEYGFDAEVQPPPTITTITPGTGPVVGNNQVVIAGEDFEGATAVRFGSLEAAFTVDSEQQITATAPASGESKSVPVTVVTAAGTKTSATPYTYDTAVDQREEQREINEQRELERREREERRLEHCIVPRLKGKRLRASRRALFVAQCMVGKVRKTRGATAKTAKVVGQKPPPGTVLRLEAKVNLTLAAGRP
jgi:IPT/TIG domain